MNHLTKTHLSSLSVYGLATFIEKLAQSPEPKEVAILCHDDPDIDCMASAYASWALLKHFGIRSTIYWGGELVHVQNKVFMNVMSIPAMVKVTDVSPSVREDIKSALSSSILWVVDSSCKLGMNNLGSFHPYVTRETEPHVVIDHHQFEERAKEIYVHSHVGSCSSILTSLVPKEVLQADSKLATALYLGIEKDTDKLQTESTTAMDQQAHHFLKDIVDQALYNSVISYPKPMSSFSLFQKVYATAIKVDNIVIGGAGLITPHQRSVVAEIADDIMRYDTVDHCCVIGIVDEGWNQPKKLVACFRNTGNAINTDEFMKSVFGPAFGGRKGAGGGSMPLEMPLTAMIDHAVGKSTSVEGKDSKDAHDVLFSSILNVYATKIITEVKKTS